MMHNSQVEMLPAPSATLVNLSTITSSVKDLNPRINQVAHEQQHRMPAHLLGNKRYRADDSIEEIKVVHFPFVRRNGRRQNRSTIEDV